jgi:hypothetical protein
MKALAAHRWRRVGLLLAFVADAGCSSSFDPYNRLTSLRVLAVRSEPVAPAPGETTTIDAKVYTPDGQPPAYAWSWCPFATAAGAPCPLAEDQAAALAGVPISYDLGTAATASFTNAIPPPALEALCAGQPGVPTPDCTDGFPIQINLTVTTSDDQVQAVRTLRLRFRPTDQANQNPSIGALYAVLAGAMQPLDGTPVLPRHAKTTIGAAIAADQSEVYNGMDDNGQPAVVHERLNMSWFVESGSTDHQRTTFIDGQVTLASASQVAWTPAFRKDYAPDSAKVIVVIRDDRQGSGWIDGAATLEPTP